MVHSVFRLAFILSIVMTGVSHAASYQAVYDTVFTQSAIIEQDSEVVAAEKQRYLNQQLPRYTVSYASVFGRGVDRLKRRSVATLTHQVDYYDRLVKLVHANGICMAGHWYITKSTRRPYTGMFAQGARSLFIGRLSTALSETKRGEPRGFALAGKLFGTLDTNQAVITQNFFVGDVLTGVQRDSIFGVAMTNHPKFTPRLGVLRMGLKLASVFSDADNNPSMRPVDNLAMMTAQTRTSANTTDTTVVAPQYLMLLPYYGVKSQTKISSERTEDFRHEFALPNNAKTPYAARYFAIYVADKPPTEAAGWEHIGFIKVDDTVVSYGCDRQLHFAHPKLDKP